jgi:hypothetical protein
MNNLEVGVAVKSSNEIFYTYKESIDFCFTVKLPNKNKFGL